MRNSITQEHDFGCGIACVAFATSKSYQVIAKHVGEEKAYNKGFLCRDLNGALDSYGLHYKIMYVKPKMRKKVYTDDAMSGFRRRLPGQPQYLLFPLDTIYAR